MGDQDDGLVIGAGKGTDHLHDFGGGSGVQVAGGLIGKDNVRPGDKGPCNAGALLLTAGHLGGEVVQTVGQSHPAEHGPGGFFPLFLGDAPEHEGEGDILGGGEVGQQVVGLEHKADVLLPEGGELFLFQTGDGDAADPDTAPGGFFHSGELVEKGTFSRTGGAEDAADFAAVDFEVDAFEGDNGLIFEGIFLADILHLDDRLLPWIQSHGNGLLSVSYYTGEVLREESRSLKKP